MGSESRSLRIDFLETFRTVCELKSFTKASQKLQKSQGGISQQITQLEDYFSAKLINRTSHGFSLTPEGQILFEKSREILQSVDQTKKEILEKSKVLSGKVTICASSTPGEYILPHFIAEFRAINPHVEFVVNISNSGVCLKKLQGKEYDLVAVGSLLEIKDTSGLLIHNMAEEEIVVICGQSHPVLQKASYNPDTSRYRIQSKELDNYSFIVREKQSGTQREFEKQYGKTFQVGLELNSPQAIITAVQDSKMLGILSAIVAKKAESAGLVSILEMEDLSPFIRKILLLRPKHAEISDVISKFWDYVVSNPFEIREEW
ncbi:MAG: transcriptional regulator, LysR family [Promethearchaeota archaeon CR_4]|nr:MAG: transcriptional regulator, LysR family [Candidatus Lokiarchaeota archaeon CR_4]